MLTEDPRVMLGPLTMRASALHRLIARVAFAGIAVVVLGAVVDLLAGDGWLRAIKDVIGVTGLVLVGIGAALNRTLTIQVQGVSRR